MRITDSMLVERFLRMHQEIMERIEKASYQLSSGKKLRYPHENPADTSQILNLKRSISEMERFLDNVNEGKAWLGITESAFDKVEDYLKRVQELTISGANDDKDRDSRLAIAQELDEIFGELVDMGNTKSMDRYIFAGTKTDEPPFSKPEENTIKVNTAGAPASLEVTDAFSDFYQFATGKYRLFMKREGTDRIAVWLEDQSGE
ncbi:MAG: flagellar hook-associated protein 3, partial [Deferribacteres bacterium]|nr:flagellar hook-associated protein 3 [Deferribacteres bacterium]